MFVLLSASRQITCYVSWSLGDLALRVTEGSILSLWKLGAFCCEALARVGVVSPQQLSWQDQPNYPAPSFRLQSGSTLIVKTAVIAPPRSGIPLFPTVSTHSLLLNIKLLYIIVYDCLKYTESKFYEFLKHYSIFAWLLSCCAYIVFLFYLFFSRSSFHCLQTLSRCDAWISPSRD